MAIETDKEMFERLWNEAVGLLWNKDFHRLGGEMLVALEAEEEAIKQQRVARAKMVKIAGQKATDTFIQTLEDSRRDRAKPLSSAEWMALGEAKASPTF